MLLSSMIQRVRQWFRRRRYRVGRTMSRFIAPDVRREVQILDTRRLDEGYITARIRTSNILYQAKGLLPASEFGEPQEIAIVDLWHWTGQPWGGLPDGNSLADSKRIAKEADS